MDRGENISSQSFIPGSNVFPSNPNSNIHNQPSGLFSPSRGVQQVRPSTQTQQSSQHQNLPYSQQHTSNLSSPYKGGANNQSGISVWVIIIIVVIIIVVVIVIVLYFYFRDPSKNKEDESSQTEKELRDELQKYRQIENHQKQRAAVQDKYHEDTDLRSWGDIPSVPVSEYDPQGNFQPRYSRKSGNDTIETRYYQDPAMQSHDRLFQKRTIKPIQDVSESNSYPSEIPLHSREFYNPADRNYENTARYNSNFSRQNPYDLGYDPTDPGPSRRNYRQSNYEDEYDNYGGEFEEKVLQTDKKIKGRSNLDFDANYPSIRSNGYPSHNQIPKQTRTKREISNEGKRNYYGSYNQNPLM